MKVENILVIEDDAVASTLLVYLIEDVLKFPVVTSCQQGAEGLQYLTKTADTAPDTFPQLIFLDLNMPYMSGYRFIEEYEAQCFLRFPNTKLAILTSSLTPEDKEIALRYRSVMGFFRKPLEEAELLYVVRKLSEATD